MIKDGEILRKYKMGDGTGDTAQLLRAVPLSSSGPEVLSLQTPYTYL